MNSFAHEQILLTLRRILFEIHNQALTFFKIFSIADVNSNKKIRKQSRKVIEVDKKSNNNETIRCSANLSEEFRPN